MKTFRIEGDRILADGKPFRIFSGAMHYFRVHPDLWRDRLRRLRAMGLNTVETYVAWNVHEPTRGSYRFDGFADLGRYLDLAAEEGLAVIVRPGPYICSEWEFGGFPGWLTNLLPDHRLRCSDEAYEAEVAKWFDVLLPVIAARTLPRGGSVVAVQVENEYGSYGSDTDYLRFLSDRLRAALPETLQFTSDGGTYAMLKGGMLPSVWPIVNFGHGAKEAFEAVRALRPGIPLMCGEYWDGWFDHWGEAHHRRSPAEVEGVVRDILALGGHVNLYMAHGGTNFGFLNGANDDGPGRHKPTVTSYDFDAPIAENGAITPKFHRLRELFRQAGADVPDEIPADPPSRAFGTVAWSDRAPLFDNLAHLSPAPLRAALPIAMEKTGSYYGFQLLRHVLRRDIAADETLVLRGLHDRAQIFLNGRPVATILTNDEKHAFSTTAREGDTLDILVENLGRGNYGAFLEDGARKGLTGGVVSGNQSLHGWTTFPLPLDDLSGLAYAPLASAPSAPAGTPTFFRGTVEVDEPMDTFLEVSGEKGVAYVNGFNLGRYWKIGPQHTLYVPAPLLRRGENVIEIFDLHAGATPPEARFLDHAILDNPATPAS